MKITDSSIDEIIFALLDDYKANGDKDHDLLANEYLCEFGDFLLRWTTNFSKVLKANELTLKKAENKELVMENTKIAKDYLLALKEICSDSLH